MSVQVALRKVIRAIGVKEFALSVGMGTPKVIRAINPRYNPTMETLDRLLRPFRLRVCLAPTTPEPAGAWNTLGSRVAAR